MRQIDLAARYIYIYLRVFSCPDHGQEFSNIIRVAKGV